MPYHCRLDIFTWNIAASQKIHHVCFNAYYWPESLGAGDILQLPKSTKKLFATALRKTFPALKNNLAVEPVAL